MKKLIFALILLTVTGLVSHFLLWEVAAQQSCSSPICQWWCGNSSPEGSCEYDGSCCMECGTPDNYEGDCHISGEEGGGAVGCGGLDE